MYIKHVCEYIKHVCDYMKHVYEYMRHVQEYMTHVESTCLFKYMSTPIHTVHTRLVGIRLVLYIIIFVSQYPVDVDTRPRLF